MCELLDRDGASSAAARDADTKILNRLLPSLAEGTDLTVVFVADWVEVSEGVVRDKAADGRNRNLFISAEQTRGETFGSHQKSNVRDSGYSDGRVPCQGLFAIIIDS